MLVGCSGILMDSTFKSGPRREKQRGGDTVMWGHKSLMYVVKALEEKKTPLSNFSLP